MGENKNPVISGNFQGKRDSKGRFKPGVSGNPDGKPIGIKSIPDILRAIGNEKIKIGNQEITRIEVVLNKVYEEAIKGTRWAVEFIADRTEGKPTQIIVEANNKWQDLIKACGYENV